MHEGTIANKIESVLVIGLGKVGSLVATLLHETGYRVTGLVRTQHEDYPFPVKTEGLGNVKELVSGPRRKNRDSHPSRLNSSSYSPAFWLILLGSQLKDFYSLVKLGMAPEKNQDIPGGQNKISFRVGMQFIIPHNGDQPRTRVSF